MDRLFQQDTAGNELWDIFAIPSEGGETANLTNTPEIREENPRWSPDGKTVALNHKPKDATVYNIALMDWATRKVTLLTHESTPNHFGNLWPGVLTEKHSTQTAGSQLHRRRHLCH